MINYIDLTHKLENNIPVYPGDPKFSLKDISDSKDDYSLFEIKGNLHTGTHIDAPYHYIKNGKKVNDLDINTLIGPASILKTKLNSELENNNNNNNRYNNKIDIDNEIKLANILNINSKDFINSKGLEKIIILNTNSYHNWGEDSYFTNNPYLSKEVANFFIENEISGIAIDTCSVDKFGENTIHKRLLKNNIWIVENLRNLDKVKKSVHYSYFIPLNIDAEASYVRVLLEE